MKKEYIQKKLKAIRHSPWSFFVERWKLTLVALVAIIIAGLGSVSSMPLESDPEIKIPIGVVSTVFPGASPTDVEELVTNELETELSTLDDIEQITSVSQEGVSSITVEFEASADITESIRKLRDKVSDAKGDLPEEAEDPTVIEIRSNDRPIITFSLLGSLSPELFKEIGEEIQEELEKISGVSEARLFGIEQRQMQILIDPTALEGLNLSLSQVNQVIRNNHLDSPVGSFFIDDFYYQGSLKAQFENAEELMELPVANRNGRNIFLKDIAEIREVFAKSQTITRIWQKKTNKYRPSVTLQVYKKTGGNIVDITKKAQTVVKDYIQTNLPQSVEVVVSGDESDAIQEDLETLGFSGLQAVVVIFLLLFIALGFREALLAALSLPFILLISFTGLYLNGETFNFMILFSLILSLGLIVDTSIVMMEGVHENMKEKKLNSKDASLLAIDTYKNPLTSSTLTTISAFLPMALTPGRVGQYIAHIPRTVSITLFSSLIVAIFILPSIATKVFENIHEKEMKGALLDRLTQPLKKWYAKKIKNLLASKLKQWLWVIAMVMATASALALPALGILTVELFPGANVDFFNVEIEGPTGSSLEDNLRIANQVEAEIESLPEVDNFVTIVGGGSLARTGGPADGGGGQTSFNQTNITVNLIKKKNRTFTSGELADQFRKKINYITNATIKVQDLQTGPPTGADVEVRIIGEDLSQMEIYAEKVAGLLKEVEGTRDVETDIDRGTGEFYFTIKRDQAEFYGLSAAQIANELRSAVFGSRQIKIIKAGEETPIVIRLDYREEDCKNNKINQLVSKRDQLTLCDLNPKNIDQINRLLMNTSKGQIPMRELVDISLNPSITTIRHLETDRIINVRGFAKEGFIAENLRQGIQKKLEKNPAPAGIRTQFGGEFEDTEESFNSLWKAMSIGLILIVFILVLQFNSFRQPFIIVFTLPLALIGVFYGLAALGRNFSFPAFIGIVALMGVVVNDAIVLIDRINTNIRSGFEKKEAITNGAMERLQPVLLTTITTATGILPLVWSSEFWVDLALAIFFGIIFATLLTLVMVPIFYNALENAKELKAMRDLDAD